MRILFIHQNMPGQYRRYLSYYSANPEHEVVGVGEIGNIRRGYPTVTPPGLKLLGYEAPKMPQLQGHPFLNSTETYVYRGEVVARVLQEVKAKGFTPDTIACHPGWGEGLYLRDIYPDARIVFYCEFYYNALGQDCGFDPEFPEAPNSEWALRTRNAIQLLSLPQMDAGFSPTAWQLSRYPKEYRHKITQAHEGIDTKLVAPDPNASIQLASGLTLTAKDDVVTYVARNLEPYRGFHTFMRALPEIQKANPKAHVLLVGGDGVSYGRRLAQGTYRERAMKEVGDKLDMSRIHFLGNVAYLDYLRMLQISSAHVYLTYPFVLSWSILEAMATEALVIGSRTAPVEEVITHGYNGLLVDFFSPGEIAATVTRALTNKSRMTEIRKAARQTVLDKFDFETKSLPLHRKLIENT